MLREISKRTAEIKTNDAIHLSCQSNTFHIYFVLVGNWLFPWIAWIIFPNGVLMSQSVSLTTVVRTVSIWFLTLMGNIVVILSRKLHSVCYINITILFNQVWYEKRESGPQSSLHDQYQSCTWMWCQKSSYFIFAVQKPLHGNTGLFENLMIGKVASCEILIVPEYFHSVLLSQLWTPSICRWQM